MTGAKGRQAGYGAVSGTAESRAALDEVIGVAQRTIRVFDANLAQRGFNTPGRAERLRQFLVAGRAHRLLIALHDTDVLERESPSLLVLLRQFPMRLEIHLPLAHARYAK